MTPYEEFIKGFTDLGFRVEIPSSGFIAFDYVVPVGKFAGRAIKIALMIPAEAPLNPPPGPHISPHLIPLNPSGSHPTGGVHVSPLGTPWQYWSRPFPGWADGDRTARRYMAHIVKLFETQ